MTLRKQLLLLLLVHLIVALAAWDGYRIGLRRGRAESQQYFPAPVVKVEPTFILRTSSVEDGGCYYIETNDPMGVHGYPVGKDHEF